MIAEVPATSAPWSLAIDFFPVSMFLLADVASFVPLLCGRSGRTVAQRTVVCTAQRAQCFGPRGLGPTASFAALRRVPW